jgi:aspartate/tyrosine/aromatic aminotransferase
MSKTLHKPNVGYGETYNEQGKELAKAIKSSLRTTVRQLVKDGYSPSEIKATMYEEMSFLVSSEVLQQNWEQQKQKKRDGLMLVDDELVAEIERMKDDERGFPIIEATKLVRSRTGLMLIESKRVAEKIRDGTWNQWKAIEEKT